jgi:hypothetical protein
MFMNICCQFVWIHVYLMVFVETYCYLSIYLNIGFIKLLSKLMIHLVSSACLNLR